MLQHLAKVAHQLVFEEARESLLSIFHSDQVSELSHRFWLSHIFTKAPQLTLTLSVFQILCFEDLQRGQRTLKKILAFFFSKLRSVIYLFTCCFCLYAHYL